VSVNALPPGGAITYTVTVSNEGQVDASGTTVSDPLPPAGITGATWSCTSPNGAVCAASGVDSLADTITTFPAGSKAIYTIVAAVDPLPPSSVTNSASATPPPGGVCMPFNTPPPCAVAIVNAPSAQISVTKTSSAGTDALSPGGAVSYTITIHNGGSVGADGTVVDDPLSPDLTNASWTCAATGNAACAASGIGAIADTLTSLPPDGEVVYTLTAQVGAMPAARVTNNVTVTPSSSNGVCLPGNTPAPCVAAVTNASGAQISLAKTSSAGTDVLIAGQQVIYTLTVTNGGQGDGAGTEVSDPLPAGIASAAWICVGANGATCAASGTGAVTDTLAAFPAGGSVFIRSTRLPPPRRRTR
jgi:uncharacterized repeat protein (TIGR01451 family)